MSNTIFIQDIFILVSSGVALGIFLSFVEVSYGRRLADKGLFNEQHFDFNFFNSGVAEELLPGISKNGMTSHSEKSDVPID